MPIARNRAWHCASPPDSAPLPPALRLDALARRMDARRVNGQHIRERLEGKFRPFEVAASGGRKYPAPHPEFILATSRPVMIAKPRGYVATLDPLHIIGIQDIHSARQNGRSQRRERGSGR